MKVVTTLKEVGRKRTKLTVSTWDSARPRPKEPHTHAVISLVNTSYSGLQFSNHPVCTFDMSK